jgi:hypothetical protein
MDFNDLRNSLLLFHRGLLEKAEKLPDGKLKEAYLRAARHLKYVASSLYQFDLTMKEIKELEREKNENH